MGITKKPGKKGKGDNIIFWNEIPINFKEVAQIMLELFNNEDKIYPPPRFQGAEMLKSFLDEVYEKRSIDNELLKKYNLFKENNP